MKGLYFLAVAYAGVWVGLFAYLLSLGNRASRLERDVRALEATAGSSPRGARGA